MFKKCYVAEVTVEGRVVGSVCVEISFFRNTKYAYDNLVEALGKHPGGVINFRRVK